MDKNQAIQIAKKYAKLVKQHLPVKSIILFGSYATGNFRKHSDIDIAVVINKIDKNFLILSSQLSKLKHEIDNRIEPVLLDSDNDPTGFLESIKQYGKIIY